MRRALVECWGDDVPDGKITDFKGAVKAEAGETIVFSWIVWPSKEVRDRANEKMQNDPRMKMTEDVPFDPKRMTLHGHQRRPARPVQPRHQHAERRRRGTPPPALPHQRGCE